MAQAYGLHESAKRNGTHIITSTELKRVYGSKKVKGKQVSLEILTALVNEEFDPAEAENVATAQPQEQGNLHMYYV